MTEWPPGIDDDLQDLADRLAGDSGDHVAIGQALQRVRDDASRVSIRPPELLPADIERAADKVVAQWQREYGLEAQLEALKRAIGSALVRERESHAEMRQRVTAADATTVYWRDRAEKAEARAVRMAPDETKRALDELDATVGSLHD